MHSFLGRRHPVKVHEINFAPCNDETATQSAKHSPKNIQEIANTELNADLNCVHHTDLLSQFVTGLNNEMVELAREVIERDKALEARILEFNSTYKPLDELLREDLMRKTFGRVWITIEALTDNCSGKITVNSVVQNIQKMIEERPHKTIKHSKRTMANTNKTPASSSVDRSLMDPSSS